MEAEIHRLMKKFNIRTQDIEEQFVRSSGPGGQNVNKVSTCVVMVHKPTNIKVKCQHSRQQSINRLEARHLLLKKIESKFEKEHRQKALQAIKLKKLNRKRSLKEKEDMLEVKRQRKAKKVSRLKLQPDQYEE